jgi:hypothetical protein
MTKAILFAFALLGLSACSFQSDLAYTPLKGQQAQSPTAMVAVTVIDKRPADKGGDDKSEIGRVRGGFGNPFPVYESSQHEVTRLVTEATTDALRVAGFGTASNAPRRVVATITEFWIDGYMGYESGVKVDLALQDTQGDVLWTGTAEGGAGGVAWWTPTGHIPDMFDRSLQQYAGQAADLFRSAAFRDGFSRAS